MEPLFFKAENLLVNLPRAAYEKLLQWSRFFSKRKIRALRRDVQVSSRASMEPLFFKAENYGVRAACVPSLPGFNGAAFFQSGKCFRLQPVEIEGWASMEPLFFKAENMIDDDSLACRAHASMEPLFFKAENDQTSSSSL